MVIRALFRVHCYGDDYNGREVSNDKYVSLEAILVLTCVCMYILQKTQATVYRSVGHNNSPKYR